MPDTMKSLLKDRSGIRMVDTDENKSYSLIQVKTSGSEKMMQIKNHPPDQSNHYLKFHVDLLCSSYERLLGKPLTGMDVQTENRAEYIYHASFALVSHDTSPNPVFNYGNQKALSLFEMTWDEFVQMESRHSAEPDLRIERQHLLKQVHEKGYIDNYSGIRISKTGRRFQINDATVWNLIDEKDDYHGQAALFESWEFMYTPFPYG